MGYTAPISIMREFIGKFVLLATSTPLILVSSVGKNAGQISLNEAIALIEKKMKKIVLPKSV